MDGAGILVDDADGCVGIGMCFFECWRRHAFFSSVGLDMRFFFPNLVTGAGGLILEDSEPLVHKQTRT